MRLRVSDFLLLSTLVSVAPLGRDAAGEETSFQRGDSNGDGRVDVSDVVHILGHIFLGTPIDCVDATDIDDDGSANITDTISLLGFLFLGDRAPPPPFRECGPDPTEDSLGCESFSSCPPLITIEVVGRGVLATGAPASGAQVTDPFGVRAVAAEDGSFILRLRVPGSGWAGSLAIELDEYFGEIRLSNLNDGDRVDVGEVVLTLPEGLQRIVAKGVVEFPDGAPAGDSTIRLGEARLSPALDGSFVAELILPLGARIPVLVQSERENRFFIARTAFVVDTTVTVDLGRLVLTDGGDLPFGGPCCRRLDAGVDLRAVALGDFDADGILDVAGADRTNGNAWVLLGAGEGSFGEAVAYPAGDGEPWSVAAGDFDGDGVLDLAGVLTRGDAVAVLIGAGDGSFGEPVAHAVGNGPQSVAVGDLDGDGVLDLAVANAGSDDVSVLFGAGDGSFGEAVSIASGDASRSVAIGDLDGDGVLDLAVANPVGQDISVLLGTSDGSFRAAVSHSVRPHAATPQSVAIGDLDRDGALDLVVANEQGDGVLNFLGAGDGTFADAVGHPLGAAPRSADEVVLGDLNGDGALDITVASGCDGVWVLLGLGNGSFREAIHHPVFAGFIAAGDLNLDGRPDLAVGGGRVIVTLRGEGNGSFRTPTPRHSTGRRPQSLVAADFDLDGALDLAVANFQSDDVSILRGLGDGSFAESVELAVGDRPTSTAVGDLHGDGLLDLVVDRTILRNLGNGIFNRSEVFQRSSVRSVALGDLNGDGLADLVFSEGSEVRVRLRLPGRRFEEPVVYRVGASPRFVRLADLDNDGRLDLLVAERSRDRIFVLLGLGGADFSEATGHRVGGRPVSAATGDLDDDGAVDLAVATSGDLSLLFGRGDGSFAEAISFRAGGNSVALADFNDDGAADIALASGGFTGAAVLLVLGLGDGVFGEPIRYPTGCRPTSLAVADFDADGTDDLAVVHSGSDDVGVFLGR